ncbi:DUF2568 domain-containing protein [Cellulomonas cellasea]|uniref:DUF2568 domain-containing protein n=1 Tax=Cellulomonas cellasea TaxID=43670 RepID=A0A4Y3KU26_9CELL|nr:DUF2568 domain-containing protein [Cellulomonas cellasea]GEA87417.1 hypothetical protein CCE01nite_13660 [Cellulomonas cellasea]
MPAPRSPSPADVGALAVAAFAGELVLLVLVAVSGWRAGGGGLPSALLSVALVAAVVTVWGLWVAPRSPRRLGRWGRWAVVSALVLANVVLAAATEGPVVPAVLLAGPMSWLFSRPERTEPA